jgi:hypothetical protein
MSHCRVTLPRVHGVIAVMVSALLMSSCSTGSNPMGPEPTPRAGGGQLTPLLDTTLSAPRWFTGTDSQVHLVYELVLTNAVPEPVALSALDVHDANTGAPLIRLTGRLAACGHVPRHVAGDSDRCSAAGIGRHCLA